MSLPSTVKTVADAISFLTAENVSKAAQIAALQGRATVLESKVPAPIAAPVITEITAIGSDGSPQVGEQLIGRDPVGNYPVSARQWLFASTFLTDQKNYTPQVEGDYIFEGTIAAPDGRTAKSRSTITVAAAVTVPALTPVKANPFPPAPSAPLPAASDVIYVARNVGYSSMFHEVDINGDVNMFNITGAKQDAAAGVDQTVDGIQVTKSSKTTLRVTARVGTSAKDVLVNGSALNFPMPDVTGVVWKPRVEITNDFVKVYAGSDGRTLVAFFNFNDTKAVYRIANGSDPALYPLLKDHVRANIADGLHTWAASFAGGNVKNDIAGEYAPAYQAMTLKSTAVSPEFKPQITVSYYTSGETSYQIQVERNSGEAVGQPYPAAVTNNDAAGTATLVGQVIPNDFIGVPLRYRLLEIKGGQPTGIEVTALLVRPTPLMFGSNSVISMARPLYTNLAINSSWQDPAFYLNDPQNRSGFRDPGTDIISLKNGIKNAPAGTTRRMNLPGFEKLPISGIAYEISWEEDQNTSASSTWNLSYRLDGDDPTSAYTDIGPVTVSGGKHRQRFTWTGNVAANTFNWIMWSGSGSADNIEIMKVSDIASGRRIPQAYIDVNSLLPGPMRGLETGNFNQSGQNYEWSNRPRRETYGKSGYLLGGVPIEDEILPCNACNRDYWMCVPILWTQTLFNDYVKAMLTGIGTDDGVGLKTNLKLFIELCGNEPWNPGLFYYHPLKDYGRQLLNDPNRAQNEARLYGQAKFSLKVLGWIKELPASYRARIVTVAGLSPANDAFDWLKLKEYGLADQSGRPLVDAVAQSIYYGIGAKTVRYGNATPAEMAAGFDPDFKVQGDAFQRNHLAFLAEGVRHLIYEVGIDLADSPYSAQERAAFSQSPEGMALYGRELRRLKTTGDMVCNYYAFGPYAKAGFGGWAHFQYEGLPSTKGELMVAIQQEVYASA